jgi:hypothetical protein
MKSADTCGDLCRRGNYTSFPTAYDDEVTLVFSDDDDDEIYDDATSTLVVTVASEDGRGHRHSMTA